MIIRKLAVQDKDAAQRSKSLNFRSAKEVSAAVSRQYGHSLSNRFREGSGTSDEVSHPRCAIRVNPNHVKICVLSCLSTQCVVLDCHRVLKFEWMQFGYEIT